MVSIEAFCPPDVFNPPAYTQGIRVTGAQTILFLSGQVAYDQQGGVLHCGDFRGQAREAFRALKSLVESAGLDAGRGLSARPSGLADRDQAIATI